MTTCSDCGDKVEAGQDGLCYGCEIARRLPKDYELQERYVLDPALGHKNATCRPPTGMEWLDTTRILRRRTPGSVGRWTLPQLRAVFSALGSAVVAELRGGSKWQ